MVFKNLNLNGEIIDITEENGKIVSLEKTDADGVDFGGLSVYPGLIDIHTHGAYGVDTMDGDFLELSRFHAENGTTTFLPTTMTAPWEEIIRITEIDTKNIDGANIWGIHMEGPYINVKYKGAQDENYIIEPDINKFSKLNNVKMITLAPEIPNAMDFIKECEATVVIGHSSSDYETTIKAIDAGAECLTHTFNAMTPLSHREPGIIGAAADKRIYAQVICDGLHIHPSVIRILYKIFGPDRMILISDSILTAGLEDGEYMIGEQPVDVKNSVTRTKDGALAGSAVPLFYCVKKAIEFGIPKEDAFRMASKTPAELLKMNKGAIEVGYDCDFLVIDENNDLKSVVIGGKQYK